MKKTTKHTFLESFAIICQSCSSEIRCDVPETQFYERHIRQPTDLNAVLIDLDDLSTDLDTVLRDLDSVFIYLDVVLINKREVYGAVYKNKEK